MSTSTLTAAVTEESDARRRRALLLVFFCTLIGAVSQILIKTGATVLAVEAGRTLMLDRERMMEEANQADIAIVGF